VCFLRRVKEVVDIAVATQQVSESLEISWEVGRHTTWRFHGNIKPEANTLAA